MILIDGRLNDAAFPNHAIVLARVCVWEEGHKGWLQGATMQPEEQDNMIRLIDIRHNAYWRGVHGYLGFGYAQEARPQDPDYIPSLSQFEPEEVFYINWKEHLIRPRKKDYNAIRLWMYPGAKAYAFLAVAPLDLQISGLQMRDPNSGDVLYQGGQWHYPPP